MGIVGSVVAFVTAQKLAQEEKKKKKKGRSILNRSSKKRHNKSLRIPVAPPTERHSASKGTGYNRKDSKKEASKEIESGIKEVMDLEKY